MSSSEFGENPNGRFLTSDKFIAPDLGSRGLADANLPNFGRVISTLATLVEEPKSEYTSDQVDRRLAWPQGYTDGSVFDGQAKHSGLQDRNWRWREFSPEDVSSLELDFAGPVRRAYEGPYYLQGRNPTCTSWAAIHGLLAAGVKPPVPLARDLLNKALPNKTGKEGLDFFAAGGIIGEHPGTSAVFNIPPVGSGQRLLVSEVASFIKNTIDGKGVVLAVVSARPRGGQLSRHTICVAGYNVGTRGGMDVQIIDSARGVGVCAVERLTRGLDINYTTPVATIKGNARRR